MKAVLKINYAEAAKGQIFNVIEIAGKRITLEVNGRNVDFGVSEAQIVAPTPSDLFNLGKELLLIGKKPIQGWREKDVTDYIKQLSFPIHKTLMRKAINNSIWIN